ncbi:hypothetical protein LINPERPRIM_LOCUS12490 [Linum perenne]
MRESLESLD